MWDLRPGVRQYLGHLDLKGQRVLELGPATGYLGFHMESCGAQVTAFEVAPFFPQDIVPLSGVDLEEHRRASVGLSRQVRNAWWYCHERLSSGVRPVYGDIYHLPGDLGRFDVATLGAILVHLANPFTALQEAARRTEKAIVITDVVQGSPVDLTHSYMEFYPGDMRDKNVVNWWGVSPGAAVKMLKVLGFPEVSVFFHEQKRHIDGDLAKPEMDDAMFTVVGQRRQGSSQSSPDLRPSGPSSPEQTMSSPSCARSSPTHTMSSPERGGSRRCSGTRPHGGRPDLSGPWGDSFAAGASNPRRDPGRL